MTRNARPHILLLSFSPLDRDPRVLRQAAFLVEEFDVTAAGFGSATGQYPHFVQIAAPHSSAFSKSIQAMRLKLGRFEQYYWTQPHVREAWEKLRGTPVDAVLANDLAALPLAARLARQHKARLLLDAHEYEPKHFSGSFLFDVFFRPLWDHIAQHYLGQVDAMTTVCDGIANLYHDEYGIRPHVITNAPYYSDIPPSTVRSGHIKMIHHGICNKLRGIESMIELMSLLDERFSLDLILVEVDPGYFKRIAKRINRTPRVTLRPPVPFDDIIPTLNRYDIGLCMLPPSTPTLQFALPNKFFEFIQAKLCICTWPSQEMARILQAANSGIITETPSTAAMAEKINALSTEYISREKDKAVELAKEHSAERNEEALLSLLRSALGHSQPSCRGHR